MLLTFLSRFVVSCVWLAGAVLALDARAASDAEHGAAHGEAAEAKEAVSKTSIKPKLKPDLKSEAKAAEPKGAEVKEESKPAAKGEGKGEPKREARSDGKAAAKGEVSMSELRDMIDQKITEVRANRQAPPVVHIKARSPKGAKAATTIKAQAGAEAPAAQASAAVSAAPPAAPALAPAGALLAPADSHAASEPEAAHHDMGHEVHWAYSGDTGPDSWGRLKPEFQQCAVGKRQSPIDIREGIAVQLDPIRFDYKTTPFRVIDNGHTVQVNLPPGNSITVQGRRYELLQFHFHRPSEERVNGRQYDMVAHLVHKDLDGKLAVVAVLLEQGKANPLVQMVWNNLPLEKEIEQPGLTPMDLTMLLPTQRQYYTYMGSLTTPPCTEGVLWMVMKQPTMVSPEQVGIFGRLYQNNARPVQATSGRLIKEGQ
jgi:carbonic anhydrase